MSYYQGDYYQGDYYQGDPFLGAIIGMGATWLGKKLLGRAAKTAGTTAIARVGAAAGTGIIAGSAGTAAVTMLPSVLRGAGNIFSGTGTPTSPYRLTQTPQFATSVTAPGCGCPSGYHMNKSISRARATYGAAPGTVCVKNRQMNVANSRALRRGLRRVSGFAKLAARARTTIKKAARTV